MSVNKFNKETQKWELHGSDEAIEMKVLDIESNFISNNVEGALRELADNNNSNKSKIEAHSSLLLSHSETIEWLKENGGSGGGAQAPSISSTFENNTVVEKEQDVYIPLYFKSPTLGDGVAFIVMDGIEVNSIAGIKQGNNKINIGKLTNLNTTVSIYVKDRANHLSNQLTWSIICGGLELRVDFDSNADYQVTDIIQMQYYITSVGTDPIIMHLKIDHETYNIECNNGFNEYIFKGLTVGVHTVTLYATSGKYSTKPQIFNIIVVNSNTLFVSSTFQGGVFNFGEPISIDYRISKIGSEEFTVKLYLDEKLEKTLMATVGNYYWTLNNIPIGLHTAKITVEGLKDKMVTLTKSFEVKEGEYTPLKITEAGLLYRLNANGRTNNDLDKESPTDNSGNGVKTTLHNFNYFTNGWVDNTLVCDGDSYVEIDMYPWSDNAIFGNTIEIQYMSNDIGKDNARIIDYTDIETPYKGIYVDINESEMKSLANTGKIFTDSEIWTTLTYVIDRKNKFGKIFIDGVCSRAFSLSDSGSGTDAKYEDFTHNQKIYLNSKKGLEKFGACKIKDLRIYNRTLSDDEIVKNFIAQEKDLLKQKEMYDFNYNNKTMPVMKLYGDMTNMTLENKVRMRIKYVSPNADKYGSSFDLNYSEMCWQGTSSLQYVLKNFTIYLKDENMADYYYTPYKNGILENIYCLKCD